MKLFAMLWIKLEQHTTATKGYIMTLKEQFEKENGITENDFMVTERVCPHRIRQRNILIDYYLQRIAWLESKLLEKL